MDPKPASGRQQHEAVRLWEAMFDQDADLAQVLFFDALLRDAKADCDRNSKGNNKDEEDEPARVFEPRQQPAPSGPVPPPPPPQVERTVVLALCAPTHLLARKHGRGSRRQPESEAMKKPRRVS